MMPSTIETFQKKTIFLIRHAESENNVAKREVFDAWKNLKSFKSLPTRRQLYCASTLVWIPMNTDLSDRGESMVLALRNKLQSNDFLANHRIELILHSHLTRAKRTCEGIFPALSTSGTVAAYSHLLYSITATN